MTNNMKQESLEEAAENYTIDFATMSAFKLGAKWQQERMYSEKDVLDAWELGAKEGLPLTRKKKQDLFKQFKKK